MTIGEYLGEWRDMFTHRPWAGCDAPLTNVLGQNDTCRLRKGHRRKGHLPHYKRTWAERLFWLRNDHWCTHTRWKNYPESGIRVSLMTPWERGPNHWQKSRRCKRCGRWEIV